MLGYVFVWIVMPTHTVKYGPSHQLLKHTRLFHGGVNDGLSLLV